MRPLITSCALCAATLVAGPALAEPIAPKVLVVTMFAEETAPWLEGRPADTRVTVAGLSKDFPDVACDAVGLCVMTTSMGYSNAATSVSAVIFSGAFDLTRTYFLVAGIAGVDPSDGTLGSALWARYVIDGGLRHEMDPSQIPSGWPNGMFGLGADAPGQKPTWGAGTEVYHLSDQLVDRALALTTNISSRIVPRPQPIGRPTRRRPLERRRPSASATRLPWTLTGTARVGSAFADAIGPPRCLSNNAAKSCACQPASRTRSAVPAA